MAGLVPGGTYLYLAAAGDAKTGGAGGGSILHNIVVNKGVASAVVTVYDGTSTNGTKVATIDASVTALGTLNYDVLCPKGVYVVMTGGNADITVSVI